MSPEQLLKNVAKGNEKNETEKQQVILAMEGSLVPSPLGPMSVLALR